MSWKFHSVEEQRAYLRTKIDRWYPTFRTGGDWYRDCLRGAINQSAIVMDAGWGQGGIICEFRPQISTLVGVDRDENSLAQNPCLDQRIVSNLAHVPRPNNCFDLIVAEFVVEHLEQPLTVAQEMFRLLKPGGAGL